MDIITSVNNENIKLFRKLKQSKYRNKHQKFIIETKYLIEEALKYNALTTIITTDHNFFNNDIEVLYVSSNVMSSLSQLETPSPYLGICDYLDNELDFQKDIVVLENIQDAGNLGTMLRNCLAFNISNVVLSSDSVDIYNNKVIKASQGAIFNLNIIKENDLKDFSYLLKNNDYMLMGTSLQNSVELNKREYFKDKKAFYFGNEGHGLSDELLDIMDINYFIPINNVNSLNVGCAQAIILYEFSLNK